VQALPRKEEENERSEVKKIETPVFGPAGYPGQGVRSRHGDWRRYLSASDYRRRQYQLGRGQ